MLKPDLTRTPFTHAELMLALTRSKQETALYFGGLAPETFFKHIRSEWSAAENLDHLNKAVSLVVRALRVPRVVARIAFGAAKAQSRRYDDIVEAYTASLQQGGAAAGRVLPEVAQQPADLAAAQRESVNAWQAVCDKLLAAINDWSETELDHHQLPHPLLGKLTVREMLFFTLYHNGHHVKQARGMLAQA